MHGTGSGFRLPASRSGLLRLYAFNVARLHHGLQVFRKHRGGPQVGSVQQTPAGGHLVFRTRTDRLNFSPPDATAFLLLLALCDLHATHQ